MDKITIINDENKEIECDVILAYEDPNTKKGYLVYTDGEVEENGEAKLYLANYNPNNPDDLELTDVETKEEIDMIVKMLEEMGK